MLTFGTSVRFCVEQSATNLPLFQAHEQVGQLVRQFGFRISSEFVTRIALDRIISAIRRMINNFGGFKIVGKIFLVG